MHDACMLVLSPSVFYQYSASISYSAHVAVHSSSTFLFFDCPLIFVLLDIFQECIEMARKVRHGFHCTRLKHTSSLILIGLVLALESTKALESPVHVSNHRSCSWASSRSSGVAPRASSWWACSGLSLSWWPSPTARPSRRTSRIR